MTPLILILCVFILLLLFLCERCIGQLSSGLFPESGNSLIRLFSVTLPQFAVIVCLAFISLPQPLLYFLLLLAMGVDLLFLRGGSPLTFCFYLELRFVLLAGLHQLALGLVAFVSGQQLFAAYHDPLLYCISFLTALVLFFMLILAVRSQPRERLTIFVQDKRGLQELTAFETYALVYVLLDCIPCMFHLPYRILCLFLSGSSFLLLLQLYLYFLHFYQIQVKAHFETEYYQLEAEHSEHIKREMELQRLTYIDHLTGVNTRRYAMQMLDALIEDKHHFSLAYIDMNGLKAVNDRFGHPAGDRYLVLTAKTLNSSLKSSDILARIGGDEFLVVSPSASADSLADMLKQVNQLLSSHETGDFHPSISYGTAEYPDMDNSNAEELLRDADRKMYAFKKERSLQRESTPGRTPAQP